MTIRKRTGATGKSAGVTLGIVSVDREQGAGSGRSQTGGVAGCGTSSTGAAADLARPATQPTAHPGRRATAAERISTQ